MNTHSDLSFSTTANVFSSGLSLDAIRQRAPAVFAHSPDERMSDKYTFIPTERVLSGLMQAGFVPVEARQSRARRSSALHARHVVRLRRRFETVQLKDAVPEVVFLNSHDGTSAYQLRLGLFRVVCTNGLIVSHGAFPAYHVSHRGNVVDDVFDGQYALGPTKPSKCRVGLGVCFYTQGAYVEGIQIIGIIRMKHLPVGHGAGQVG